MDDVQYDGYAQSPMSGQYPVRTEIGFAPVTFNDSRVVFPDPSATLVPLHIRFVYNGYDSMEIAMGWQKASGDYVYRILGAEDHDQLPDPSFKDLEWGASRDDGVQLDLWSVTGDLPFVNSVAVWRYTDNGEKYIDSRPQLHARGSFVIPPFDISSRVDDRQVSVGWRHLAGDGKTLVFRFEGQRAFKRATRHGSEQLVIAHRDKLIHTTSLNSFEDTSIEPGKIYYYALVNTVSVFDEDEYGNEIERQVYSQATPVEVAVEADLQPVALTAYSKTDDAGDYVEITFPVVPGSTSVYTHTAPAPLELAELSTRYGAFPLEDAEHIINSWLAANPDKTNPFDERNRIHNAIVEENGINTIRRAPWLPDVSRMYLTPLSTSNGQVIFGPSVVVLRVGHVQDLRLHQRLTWQQVSFIWPEEANRVELFVRAAGEYFDAAGEQPSYEVRKEAYETEGGFRIRLDVTRDWDIYVRGVTNYRGKNLYGAFAKTTVPGLYPFSYSLTLETLKLSWRKSVEVLRVDMKYEGHTRLPASIGNVSLVLAYADRAPLASARSLFNGFKPIPVYRGVSSEGQQLVHPIKVPVIEPGAIVTIGYANAAGMTPDHFYKIRLLVDSTTDDVKRIALRRRSIQTLAAPGQAW
ncbi:MAG: hypothetical protein WBH82_01380 [Arcanobacterium sp.]